ncbi:hypothetical protein [Hymenobacter canadensis]|uniref:Uncharacterized protein n=1 Tax=Hymenobacter canadensis TaxID=2999067 RepID=A0ABY7LV14_9BACT|nr:hypothetical protein [Hymenobacter canadensis]WBA43434.1 hypothetical protein O3303_07660 [Hymenobacter canadensis]
MSFLLRLKPWLLFTITFGLPMLVALAGNVGLLLKPVSLPFFLGCFIVSTGMFALGIFSWLWALGTKLPSLLPSHVSVSSKLLKVSLLAPALYIAAILAVLAWVSNQGSMNPAFAFVLLPLHLLSMAGIFYGLYFVAKTLKSVELQRPASFSEFVGEFFLLWFFPVGIWVIQPRINRLFAQPSWDA